MISSALMISLNVLAPEWNQKQFFELLNQLLAIIPYDLYIKQEKYFHTLFYLILKLAGVKIEAEFQTQFGRGDAVIAMNDKILVFELKYNETAEFAMNQIKERKYYEMFLDRKLPIYLIGLNIKDTERNITDYLVDRVGKN